MTRPLIGITAARRSEEQSALVRAVGGEPMVGPCIGLEEPTPDPEILTGIDSALAAPLDIAVFLTGIGTMHLFQAVERAGRIGIFRAALGVPGSWHGEPSRVGPSVAGGSIRHGSPNRPCPRRSRRTCWSRASPDAASSCRASQTTPGSPTRCATGVAR